MQRGRGKHAPADGPVPFGVPRGFALCCALLRATVSVATVVAASCHTQRLDGRASACKRGDQRAFEETRTLTVRGSSSGRRRQTEIAGAPPHLRRPLPRSVVVTSALHPGVSRDRRLCWSPQRASGCSRLLTNASRRRVLPPHACRRRFRRKIESYSHEEFNTQEFKTRVYQRTFPRRVMFQGRPPGETRMRIGRTQPTLQTRFACCPHRPRARAVDRSREAACREGGCSLPPSPPD